jgi:hypothetical protein
MKRVYICSPLSGNIDANLKQAKRYMLYALRCGTAPVVPHFYALALDDRKQADRQLGRNAGLSLLWMCDELWVFGDVVSEGMQVEINFCQTMRIKIRTISEKEVLYQLKGETIL